LNRIDDAIHIELRFDFAHHWQQQQQQQQQ